LAFIDEAIVCEELSHFCVLESEYSKEGEEVGHLQPKIEVLATDVEELLKS
jgi:hypothetical protein